LPIQTSEELVELNYAFQLTPLAVFPPGHPVRHPPRRDIDASEHLDFRLPYPAHAMIEARQVTDEQKV